MSDFTRALAVLAQHGYDAAARRELMRQNAVFTEAAKYGYGQNVSTPVSSLPENVQAGGSAIISNPDNSVSIVQRQEPQTQFVANDPNGRYAPIEDFHNQAEAEQPPPTPNLQVNDPRGLYAPIEDVRQTPRGIEVKYGNHQIEVYDQRPNTRMNLPGQPSTRVEDNRPVGRLSPGSDEVYYGPPKPVSQEPSDFSKTIAEQAIRNAPQPVSVDETSRNIKYGPSIVNNDGSNTTRYNGKYNGKNSSYGPSNMVGVATQEKVTEKAREYATESVDFAKKIFNSAYKIVRGSNLLFEDLSVNIVQSPFIKKVNSDSDLNSRPKELNSDEEYAATFWSDTARSAYSFASSSVRGAGKLVYAPNILKTKNKPFINIGQDEVLRVSGPLYKDPDVQSFGILGGLAVGATVLPGAVLAAGGTGFSIYSSSKSIPRFTQEPSAENFARVTFDVGTGILSSLGFVKPIKNLKTKLVASREAPETIFDADVLAGRSKLAKTSSVEASMQDFQAVKTSKAREVSSYERVTVQEIKGDMLPDNYVVATDTLVGKNQLIKGYTTKPRVKVASASPAPLTPADVITPPSDSPGALGVEPVGLYVTPANRVSPNFLRVARANEVPSLGILPEFGVEPTITRITVTDVERLPRDILLTPDYQQSNTYMTSRAKEGKAFIDKRSEAYFDLEIRGTIGPSARGGTPEIEAIVPKDTKLLPNLKTWLGKVFGFEKYTEYEGEIVRIRDVKAKSSKNANTILGAQEVKGTLSIADVLNEQYSYSDYASRPRKAQVPLSPMSVPVKEPSYKQNNKSSQSYNSSSKSDISSIEFYGASRTRSPVRKSFPHSTSSSRSIERSRPFLLQQKSSPGGSELVRDISEPPDLSRQSKPSYNTRPNPNQGSIPVPSKSSNSHSKRFVTIEKIKEYNARESNENKSEQGFFVQVRRNGKFFTVSRLLDKQDAMTFGRQFVGRTSAATFRLVAGGNLIDKKGVRPESFADPFTVYEKNTKNGSVFIEKNKFRINTGGELKEVTFAPRKKRKRFF